LIEDEDALAVGLADVLSVKGYQTLRESRGDEGLRRALEGGFDLLLLDAELPGLSGFEVLRRLRAAGHDVPVLMLTARQTEMDRVLGFELGGDDYLTKPFSLLELLGRIAAILRRARAAAPPRRAAQLVLGRAELDLERFKASRDGAELSLPSKAFEVLKVLLEQRGKVVSREALIDGAWGHEEGVTLRTLNNVIVKIRQAIEPAPDEPRHLMTVHGVGYRLEA
jgi:DNA-binding response OmpR family regulator